MLHPLSARTSGIAMALFVILGLREVLAAGVDDDALLFWEERLVSG